jgi:pilus assembly protein Flp/PilA
LLLNLVVFASSFFSQGEDPMSTLIKIAKRFVREEAGVTAIEYGLLAVLIALVMASGALVVGNGLDKLFTETGTTLDSVGQPTVPTAP